MSIITGFYIVALAMSWFGLAYSVSRSLAEKNEKTVIRLIDEIVDSIG